MDQKIDIIVPTYNRPNDIKKFIGEFQKQTYPDFKVWIIDDHGSINIKEFVPEKPNFIFIRQPKNRGQAYVRNIAIESGKGEIVISMDDDAWFDNDDNALQKVISYFDTYPDLGCLMFNIATPKSSYNKITIKGQEIPYHVTCGCAYRRTVLEKIKGFSGFLHSGAEEMDVTLKIIEAGYKIRFAPDIKVFHDFNPSERTLYWYLNVRYNTTRNDLLVVVMRYPFYLVGKYIIGKYFSHFRYAVFNKKKPVLTLIITSMAFFGFLVKLPFAILERKPLNKAQYSYWRSLM